MIFHADGHNLEWTRKTKKTTTKEEDEQEEDVADNKKINQARRASYDSKDIHQYQIMLNVKWQRTMSS